MATACYTWRNSLAAASTHKVCFLAYITLALLSHGVSGSRLLQLASDHLSDIRWPVGATRDILQRAGRYDYQDYQEYESQSQSSTPLQVSSSNLIFGGLTIIAVLIIWACWHPRTRARSRAYRNRVRQERARSHDFDSQPRDEQLRRKQDITSLVDALPRLQPTRAPSQVAVRSLSPHNSAASQHHVKTTLPEPTLATGQSYQPENTPRQVPVGAQQEVVGTVAGVGQSTGAAPPPSPFSGYQSYRQIARVSEASKQLDVGRDGTLQQGGEEEGAGEAGAAAQSAQPGVREIEVVVYTERDNEGEAGIKPTKHDHHHHNHGHKDGGYHASWEDTCCVICLEEWDPQGDAVVELACGHPLHRTCALQWAEKQAPGQEVCPTCKRPMFPQVEGGAAGRE